MISKILYYTNKYMYSTYITGKFNNPKPLLLYTGYSTTNTINLLLSFIDILLPVATVTCENKYQRGLQSVSPPLPQKSTSIWQNLGTHNLSSTAMMCIPPHTGDFALFFPWAFHASMRRP